MVIRYTVVNQPVLVYFHQQNRLSASADSGYYLDYVLVLVTDDLLQQGISSDVHWEAPLLCIRLNAKLQKIKSFTPDLTLFVSSNIKCQVNKEQKKGKKSKSQGGLQWYIRY